LPAAAIPDQYIVELKPGGSPHEVAPTHGVAVKFIYQKVLNGFAGTVPPGRLAALKADPRVARVVPDRAVHAIGKPTGGGSTPPPQVVPEGVKRIGAAPGALTVSGNGVGVAIVDTGVDFLHTDLHVSATSFSAFGGSGQDNHGHGTHVAGIVAANDNTTDVVGVAPKATIYAVKVLDASGSGSDAAVISGLDWVTANAGAVIPPIKVANMSLGRSGTIDDNVIMHTAVQNLVDSGITLVVAAGNNALGEVSQFVPATYPEVIAVASTTAVAGTSLYRGYPGGIPADTASYFTTDGEFVNGIGVSISAPGEDAEDITRGGSILSNGILSLKLGGGTTRMSGTSMAAPHVTGVAALLCEQNSALTPDEIWTRITGSASRFGIAPLNSPTSNYTFDGEREGILSAPGTLTVPPPAP
jgi:subtilisin family serine protease